MLLPVARVGASGGCGATAVQVSLVAGLEREVRLPEGNGKVSKHADCSMRRKGKSRSLGVPPIWGI